MVQCNKGGLALKLDDFDLPLGRPGKDMFGSFVRQPLRKEYDDQSSWVTHSGYNGKKDAESDGTTDIRCCHYDPCEGRCP